MKNSGELLPSHRGDNFFILTGTPGTGKTSVGIPDLVAYAVRFGVDLEEFENASPRYRYNSTVFVFTPWRDIFVNDGERKGTFEMYADFHERILASYRKLHFDLVEVPFETVEARATFIMERATHAKE